MVCCTKARHIRAFRVIGRKFRGSPCRLREVRVEYVREAFGVVVDASGCVSIARRGKRDRRKDVKKALKWGTTNLTDRLVAAQQQGRIGLQTRANLEAISRRQQAMVPAGGRQKSRRCPEAKTTCPWCCPSKVGQGRWWWSRGLPFNKRV